MMMLKDKIVVIYGGGAVGGAVARASAQAGARVHLAGRSRARLEEVASEIGAAVAVVDALDERAVAEHADAVAAEAGGIDVALNAVSFPFAHDAPFVELTVEEVMRPVEAYLRTNLITAKAVAQHMGARGSGTILTLSAGAARAANAGSLGYGTACAAIETLTQRLAVELGPSGVRVVCLRPHLIADAPAHGSYTGALFERRAAAAGVGVEQLLANVPRNVTLLGRLPTLADVADAAVFTASDHAGAITGTVIDLTSGNAVRTTAGGLVGLLD
ncbi:NADP-dependent 3-hydroxy acid dehydrogenase YdfG [Pseudonocardia hierapolitana]|uniref:NADP-dependent 3-hydroxy acid dehydrogenase YdfG n=1 Tax=Pseudonocardia hierapolitana TaxID=1128676 RepID=A0A561SQY7_9PSEU|nr:SDR family oxidoreductase [Pseudonocardia hierapolitana]TWF77256.1 NADP-dependent 3-hydroxy acid dehydrogenase YdfG [Pseudonocardia hierapolitana]